MNPIKIIGITTLMFSFLLLFSMSIDMISGLTWREALYNMYKSFHLPSTAEKVIFILYALAIMINWVITVIKKIKKTIKRQM